MQPLLPRGLPSYDCESKLHTSGEQTTSLFSAMLSHRATCHADDVNDSGRKKGRTWVVKCTGGRHGKEGLLSSCSLLRMI